MKNGLSYNPQIDDADKMRMMRYLFLTLSCVLNYILVGINANVAALYWVTHNIIVLVLRYYEAEIDNRTVNRYPLDLILRNPITQLVFMRLYPDIELFVSLKLIPEILSMIYFMLYYRAQYNVLIGHDINTNQTTRYALITILECLSRIITYTVFFATCKNIFPWILPLLVELLIMCIDVDRLISISVNTVSSAIMYETLNPMHNYSTKKIYGRYLGKIKQD